MWLFDLTMNLCSILIGIAGNQALPPKSMQSIRTKKIENRNAHMRRTRNNFAEHNLCWEQLSLSRCKVSCIGSLLKYHVFHSAQIFEHGSLLFFQSPARFIEAHRIPIGDFLMNRNRACNEIFLSITDLWHTNVTLKSVYPCESNQNKCTQPVNCSIDWANASKITKLQNVWLSGSLWQCDNVRLIHGCDRLANNNIQRIGWK